MIIKLFWLLVNLCCFLPIAVYGQYASSVPRGVPLWNKSPYFSAWIQADKADKYPGVYPYFFTSFAFEWSVYIRVDGSPYRLQGEIYPYYYYEATLAEVYMTPTRTIFTLAAGPVSANLTYLSPIELRDWTLHSFPFTYLAIDVWSTDGRPHSVQVYTDVTTEYLSSYRPNTVSWSTVSTSKSIYHQAQRSTIEPLVENNEMSEDGTIYFALGETPGVARTWQTCSSVVCRNSFSTAGRLTNTSDTAFRAIRDDWPVLAFALDLGEITQTSYPLLFSLGLVRDPILKYIKDGTAQARSSLWWARWNNIGNAIDDFLANFSSALSRATTLDNKVVSDVTAVAYNLSLSTTAQLTDLVILGLRQAIGSLEFTVSKFSNGTFARVEDSRIFMKDVGNSRRTNPVEIIYASFPAFLYLNASLAGALLEPLLEFSSSASPSFKECAAPDLGNSWPLVLGNDTSSTYKSLGVDSSGAMLVMALAHARKSGDLTLIRKYQDLLYKWSDFLVTNSLQLNGSMTADGLVGATSNLALKGIMGIYAMGEIAKLLESRSRNPKRASYYLDTARNYSRQWQGNAFSSDHVISIYGDNTSWGMLYNLYAPKLLGADIISDMAFQLQSSWYSSQSAKAAAYGLPFDSSQPNIVKAHWTLLSAASLFNTSSVRDILIGMVHKRSLLTYFNPSTYLADVGNTTSGMASPAMGAAVAFLALNMPDIPIQPEPSNKLELGVILGAAIGSVVGLAFIIVAICLYRRRRRKPQEVEPPAEPTPSMLSSPDKSRWTIASDLSSGQFRGFPEL